MLLFLDLCEKVAVASKRKADLDTIVVSSRLVSHQVFIQIFIYSQLYIIGHDGVTRCYYY